MATAKKTPTKKKSTKVVKARPLTWKFYVTTIGIFVVAVSTVVVIALFTANYVQNRENNERLSRIQDVYSSLQLGNEYQLEHTNVFGDKRVYDWDKGRTYSSSVEYLRGENVTTTFNDLDAKIRGAGYTFTGEPYPGSVNKQYHYKSDNGEFIRLTVSSKQYSDAVRNAAVMGKDITTVIDQFEGNTDEGPALVTIKVNLDDNNE